MSHARGTVLVVEDDAQVRQLIRTTLEMAGYAVVEASDAGKALAYLVDHELPSLIVLDLILPHIDGWSFRRIQLENSRLAPVPVLGITGLFPDPRLEEHLGLEGLLGKPLQLADLLLAVHALHPPARA